MRAVHSSPSLLIPAGQVRGMSEANTPNPQLQPEAIWPYTELRPIRSYFLPPLRFGRLHGVYQVGLLSELTVGDKGVLVALDLPENVQNHLMHMGFVPGAEVTALRRAPAGDPTLYGIDGMEIALRHETASAIQIRPVEVRSAEFRSIESTAQPTHGSSIAPKRGSAVAPKLVEAAR
jgi:ferrous iron transport protein A